MIKAFALLVALAFALPARLGAQALAEPAYPVAEYDCAATVVMHEPGYGLFVGTMHPAAALFMDYFDAEKATAEHEGYQRILSDMGVEVVTVREILLKDCVDSGGNPVDGDALNELCAFASRFCCDLFSK